MLLFLLSPLNTLNCTRWSKRWSTGRGNQVVLDKRSDELSPPLTVFLLIHQLAHLGASDLFYIGYFSWAFCRWNPLCFDYETLGISVSSQCAGNLKHGIQYRYEIGYQEHILKALWFNRFCNLFRSRLASPAVSLAHVDSEAFLNGVMTLFSLE
jgi:hypothetical protein